MDPYDQVSGPSNVALNTKSIVKSNTCPRLFTYSCLTLGFTNHMFQYLHTKRLMRENVSDVGADTQLGGDTQHCIPGNSALQLFPL